MIAIEFDIYGDDLQINGRKFSGAFLIDGFKRELPEDKVIEFHQRLKDIYNEIKNYQEE